MEGEDNSEFFCILPFKIHSSMAQPRSTDVSSLVTPSPSSIAPQSLRGVEIHGSTGEFRNRTSVYTPFRFYRGLFSFVSSRRSRSRSAEIRSAPGSHPVDVNKSDEGKESGPLSRENGVKGHSSKLAFVAIALGRMRIKRRRTPYGDIRSEARE